MAPCCIPDSSAAPMKLPVRRGSTEFSKTSTAQLLQTLLEDLDLSSSVFSDSCSAFNESCGSFTNSSETFLLKIDSI